MSPPWGGEYRSEVTAGSMRSQPGVRVRSLSKNATSKESVTFSVSSSNSSVRLPAKNSVQFDLNPAVAALLSLYRGYSVQSAAVLAVAEHVQFAVVAAKGQTL